jgi:hypothetical protein
MLRLGKLIFIQRLSHRLPSSRLPVLADFARSAYPLHSEQCGADLLRVCPESDVHLAMQLQRTSKAKSAGVGGQGREAMVVSKNLGNFDHSTAPASCAIARQFGSEIKIGEFRSLAHAIQKHVI